LDSTNPGFDYSVQSRVSGFAAIAVLEWVWVSAWAVVALVVVVWVSVVFCAGVVLVVCGAV